MRTSLIVATVLSLALAATSASAGSRAEGVSAAPQNLGPPGGETSLGDLVYLAAQAMADRAGVLAKDRPIIVSTVVSIDDLSQSSTFGRLAAQLVANRLTQRGYLVRDVTYMRALTVQPTTGEMVLSREASKISSVTNAQAVVAGTYAVGGREIYLSLRMLRADNGELLSTADVVLPYDHNMEDLLGTQMRWSSHDAPIPPHHDR